jgi:phosphopantothenoylcysteine decarboxylase/phosphopantothenate--cysteine ligase
VLIGVTAGIAAYKSAELVRRLREAGAEVQVAMTRGATAFIGALTLQAVSARPVRSELLDPAAEAGMGHIELARWPDVILVAPATADFMARLAHGLADDLLATLCLASDRPLLLAPAMNRLMWANAATQENVAILQRRGIRLLGPAQGDQACGEVGAGRMLEPMELVAALSELPHPLQSGALQGRTVMVTAGPTREALDPVRYISNRSSGRMGYAIAAAAVAAGARVLLISGPVTLPMPAGVERICVESAADMHQAVMARIAECQIFIATAAVADYRAAVASQRKMKKSQERLSIELVRNPDILAEVAAAKPRPFTVGFAAETHDVLEYAAQKRVAKGLDMIAANEVGEGKAFDQEDNELQVLWDGGSRRLGPGPKSRLAEMLVAMIAETMHA